jgi:ATP-dependent exoDNAse (exonuclease V) beta subunit
MKSSQQQNNILIGDIQECLARNYQPHDLAIIYKGVMGKEIDNFYDLKNQLTNLNIPYCDISKNKSDFNIQEPGIRIVTAKSSLGLEFKVVFIIWVQMFGIEEAESKKQLYVAMTRAQEELYLYGYGGFDFMESLASNPYLQLVKK